MTYLAFIVAAASGAAVRYLLSETLDSSRFPYGQFLANSVGSFAFGVALYFFVSGKLDEQYKSLILVAFLGSLTTFSSFSASALQFIQKGQVNQFFILVFATNIVAILGCWIGYFFSSRWIG